MVKTNKVSLDIRNILKENISSQKKEKNILSDDDVKNILDISLIENLTESKELSKVLIDGSVKLFNINMKNIIELGELFSDIFKKISCERNGEEGLYEKWLKINGFSKSTALRYRKRFELYSMVNDNTKRIILSLAQKNIDEMYSRENLDEIIDEINNGISKEELISKLNSSIGIEEKIIKREDTIVSFDFNTFENTFVDIKSKVNLLEENEKKELQKYLEKINKILNKDK